MDPQVCFMEIVIDLATRERESAIEHLRALADWLEHGGFLPKVNAHILADCMERAQAILPYEKF